MNKRIAFVLLVAMLAASTGLVPVRAQGSLCTITTQNGVVNVGKECSDQDLADISATISAVPSTAIAVGYDEQGAGLIAGQTELVAVIVRRIQAGVWGAKNDTEAQKVFAVEIPNIQQQASAAHATVLEGEPLVLPFQNTWLIWCSNASNWDTPADTTFPLKARHKGLGQIAIWAPDSHYDKPPDPSLRTVSGCQGGKNWAVALK
jgi:hypothetical protein